MKKKALLLLFILISSINITIADTLIPVPIRVKLPTKYTEEYINTLSEEYKKISTQQIIHVALDMMKDTTADYSRKAIMGFNLTQEPIKIEFKDLSELNPSYANFDAVGWKKRNKLYIYINPKHEEAPPAALAALLSHEALHQDEFNSLSEETYAWTLEANVWYEMLKRFPESNNLESPLVMRENILKELSL